MRADKQLHAPRTWQHVIEAGASFGVAQQRLWSEDYQLQGKEKRQSEAVSRARTASPANKQQSLPVLPAFPCL